MTGENISSCTWKCLLYNQGVLHDINNSIILFRNVSEFIILSDIQISIYELFQYQNGIHLVAV